MADSNALKTKPRDILEIADANLISDEILELLIKKELAGQNLHYEFSCGSEAICLFTDRVLPEKSSRLDIEYKIAERIAHRKKLIIGQAQGCFSTCIPYSVNGKGVFTNPFHFGQEFKEWCQVLKLSSDLYHRTIENIITKHLPGGFGLL